VAVGVVRGIVAVEETWRTADSVAAGAVDVEAALSVMLQARLMKASPMIPMSMRLTDQPLPQPLPKMGRRIPSANPSTEYFLPNNLYQRSGADSVKMSASN
jgi:hypothetical protein